MRRLRVIIPIGIAVVAVTAISISVVLAQENEKGDSNASKLAAKVAVILGLDAAVVDDAIKQAREQLRDEAGQKKLNALVEKGRLTQEQADQYLNWIQSKPEGIPAMEKQSFEKRGHHRVWKSHRGFFGSRNNFGGKPSYKDVQKKLNAMIEDGDITQEEAVGKLKVLQANEADKTASP